MTLTPETWANIGILVGGNILFLTAAYAGYKYGRAVERRQ